jgi:hypothetical protein
MIAPQIVDTLNEAGMIYADTQTPEPNVVFLHRNARRRVLGASIYSIRDTPSSLSYDGEKSTAWFYIGDLMNAHKVATVESPIDALSLFSLKGSPSMAVVSCAGSIVPDELLFHAYNRNQSLIVAFNNTKAGDHAWQKAWDDTADWAGFKISSECPVLKDWNADLLQNGKSRSIKI